jgi:hypothetical protein
MVLVAFVDKLVSSGYQLQPVDMVELLELVHGFSIETVNGSLPLSPLYPQTATQLL